jgi:hypothetical protein
VKISVDDVELYTLSTTKKDVIKNDIASEIFEDDMKRRVEWVLMHKYNESFRRLKAEWDPKLEAAEVDPIPTDPDLYATTVFAQPDYKDKSTRVAEGIDP